MMDLFGRAAKFEILVSGPLDFLCRAEERTIIQPHLMAAFGAATWSMPDLHRSERARARGPSIADGCGGYGDAGAASRCGAPCCAGDDQNGPAASDSAPAICETTGSVEAAPAARCRHMRISPSPAACRSMPAPR